MNGSNPLISVIVPVYNDAGYLEMALESLRVQTLRDFEVLISDDGSTDASTQIAMRYVSEDKRFRLERNETNLGMTQNWNTALNKSWGQYVAKLDADDTFQPDALKTMVSALQRYPSATVFCRAISCDAELRPTGSYRGERAFILHGLEPLTERAEQGHFWYWMAFDDYQLWHSNAFLIERDRFMQMGGWDERWGCAADTDFILRVLEQNLSVVHCPYPGVMYRHREGSVSDLYRKNNKLEAEGAAICLRSLVRYNKAGGQVNGRLARNWFRIWRNWSVGNQLSSESGDLHRLRLPELDIAYKPALQVILTGRVWQFVNSLKIRLNGYASL